MPGRLPESQTFPGCDIFDYPIDAGLESLEVLGNALGLELGYVLSERIEVDVDKLLDFDVCNARVRFSLILRTRIRSGCGIPGSRSSESLGSHLRAD